MKTGFERLRGAAAASAIGMAGLLGGGSARAATTPTPVSIADTGAGVYWTAIGNTQGSLMSGQAITTTAGLSLTKSMSGFAIVDASLTNGVTTWNDFYDGGMSLAVDGVVFANPDNTVDLNVAGDTLTSDVVRDIIPGIDAQIEYYFHPTRHLVRGLYTLTNTTGGTISTSALVMGNYGSDAQTTVQATSDGDRVVEDTDLWVVTNDSGVAGVDSTNDPTATLATHGSDALVIPKTVITVGSPAGGADAEIDNYGYRYDLNIPANGRVRILVFNEMTTLIGDATAGAADFANLNTAANAGLLNGIDPAAQDEIVNYVPADSGGGGGGNSIFALGMPGLLGMLGSLLLFRQRGRQDRRETPHG